MVMVLAPKKKVVTVKEKPKKVAAAKPAAA